MRYIVVLTLICFFAGLTGSAQNYYWVSFSDKNNSEYSLTNPQEYLSDRAIERRAKQNIEIDSLDLPPNKSYIDSVLSLDVELVHASKWLNGMTIKTEIDSLENQLLPWSFIKYVQRSKPRLTSKSAVAKFKESDMMLEPIDTSRYGGSVNQVGMLNGQYLHNENYKGQGIQIAVIDAGFINADVLPAFDSLWHNNQVLGTNDILNHSSDIFNTPGDYHGMSVLSCMGGNIEGQLIGTAPKASYWLIRSENIFEELILEEDNWTVAAEFADSVGVDVINSSLGYYEFDDASTSHKYADMDGKTTRVTQAANIAASRGILVFTSAGNERNDPWERIIAPSDGELVIGVGAVDKDLEPAYFTSVGPAASGAVKPNVSAMGVYTVLQKSTGAIGVANGTSFSSPVMAGMAACLWQKHPDATAVLVKQAIEQSAHQYHSPDSLLGYGIPNMKIASELLSKQSVPYKEIESNWRVYPNPIQNKIVVQNNGTNFRDEINIELYSLAGQLIKNWIKPASATIVLSDIPAQVNGMFILRISNDKYAETFKLSKAN